MPRYDYECPKCETIKRDVLRNMSHRNDPLPCKKCGVDMGSSIIITGLADVDTWPPESYKRALRVQGIDVERSIAEHGGITDFNVTGDAHTVIKSRKHYNDILKARGLQGEHDLSDSARDLERVAGRRPIVVDFGSRNGR